MLSLCHLSVQNLATLLWWLDWCSARQRRPVRVAIGVFISSLNNTLLVLSEPDSQLLQQQFRCFQTFDTLTIITIMKSTVLLTTFSLQKCLFLLCLGWSLPQVRGQQKNPFTAKTCFNSEIHRELRLYLVTFSFCKSYPIDWLSMYVKLSKSSKSLNGIWGQNRRSITFNGQFFVEKTLKDGI